MNSHLFVFYTCGGFMQQAGKGVEREGIGIMQLYS